jgi:predicted ferric reductase
MTTTTAPRIATPTVVPSDPHARRHARRHRAADLLAIGVWASAAAAVALYLAGGLAIRSLSDAVTVGGIVVGLVGSDLVLVMLVLAARIPLIDRTVGHDRALALHRSIGKPAFYLLLAHGALLTAGYALADGTNVIAETASLLGSPDMPLAYISIALFVAVIVTSLVAVRRRFPYEVWQGIHLLSYVAVLTAIPHQLSQGAILAEGAWQRVYWIALYVLALGAIVTFRVVEPVVQSLRHQVTVERVDPVGPDAIAITLRGTRLDRLGAAGGQFFQWRFWTPGTWWHAHPVSLSAAPTATTARITVRALGNGTRRLATQLRPGTPVSFAGPYGIFTAAARGRRRVAVVAAGIGVTPVRALLEDLEAAPGEVRVLIRASDHDSLYHWDEIAELCEARGWSSWISVGPRAGGTGSWLSARDADRGVTLASLFPDLADSDLYICGAPEWANAVEAAALGLRLSSTHIHREGFDW